MATVACSFCGGGNVIKTDWNNFSSHKADRWNQSRHSSLIFHCPCHPAVHTTPFYITVHRSHQYTVSHFTVHFILFNPRQWTFDSTVLTISVLFWDHCVSIMGIMVVDHLLLRVICGEIHGCGCLWSPVVYLWHFGVGDLGTHCKPVLLILLGPYQGLVLWPLNSIQFLGFHGLHWISRGAQIYDIHLFWPFHL